jgi:hypothetical protein
MHRLISFLRPRILCNTPGPAYSYCLATRRHAVDTSRQPTSRTHKWTLGKLNLIIHI